MFAWCARTNEFRSHVLRTFELLKERMSFVLACQATVELLFIFTDQCLYVNKSLNSTCSSYKVIEALQKIWTKLFNSYGLVLQSLYEVSKW